MEILQANWKQNLRPRAVVGYWVKIFLPSPPYYVTRSPGSTSARNIGVILDQHMSLEQHVVSF